MSENDNYPEGWFDEFWCSFDGGDDEDGVSAVRLVGELFAAEAIWRDGDKLIGKGGNVVWMNPGDQFLVRRIEDAVEYARKATS